MRFRRGLREAFAAAVARRAVSLLFLLGLWVLVGEVARLVAS